MIEKMFSFYYFTIFYYPFYYFYFCYVSVHLISITNKYTEKELWLYYYQYNETEWN